MHVPVHAFKRGAREKSALEFCSVHSGIFQELYLIQAGYKQASVGALNGSPSVWTVLEGLQKEPEQEGL